MNTDEHPCPSTDRGPGRHPCFDGAARHGYRRVHLPVAPRCNIQCRFCDRRHDCVNESRPGVTSVELAPAQAVQYLGRYVEKYPDTSVAGIAGPGDPLANWPEVEETLRLAHQQFPDLQLCLATNGLRLPGLARHLAERRVSHLSVTVNAVDVAVGQRIYAWVREGKRIYRGDEAFQLLFKRQCEGLRAAKDFGLTVKVNTILIPGVNDDQMEKLARKVAELGADRINVMPLCPVPGTDFGAVQPPSANVIAEVRKKVAQYLPPMLHCARCRADAAGHIGEQNDSETTAMLKNAAVASLRLDEDRPCVAVASHDGLLVNQHLGEATEFYIFRQDTGGIRCISRRKAPASGLGVERWRGLARVLSDCRALLVHAAGEPPKAALSSEGLLVLETEGLIQQALTSLYRGERPAMPVARTACGSGCGGRGVGCA